MRRLVAPLLALGTVLLVAALVWPTERIEVVAGEENVPLLDIWLWGRVRSLSELSTTQLDGSFGTLAVLVLAALLAVVGGAVWVSAVRRPRAGRRRGVVAATAVLAALAAAALGLTVMAADLGFGWYAYGEPGFRDTAVATFPPIAVGAWGAALLVMVVLLRHGPDEGSDGSSAGSSGD